MPSFVFTPLDLGQSHKHQSPVAWIIREIPIILIHTCRLRSCFDLSSLLFVPSPWADQWCSDSGWTMAADQRSFAFSGNFYATVLTTQTSDKLDITDFSYSAVPTDATYNEERRSWDANWPETWESTASSGGQESVRQWKRLRLMEIIMAFTDWLRTLVHGTRA